MLHEITYDHETIEILNVQSRIVIQNSTLYPFLIRTGKSSFRLLSVHVFIIIRLHVNLKQRSQMTCLVQKILLHFFQPSPCWLIRNQDRS